MGVLDESRGRRLSIISPQLRYIRVIRLKRTKANAFCGFDLPEEPELPRSSSAWLETESFSMLTQINLHFAGNIWLMDSRSSTSLIGS